MVCRRTHHAQAREAARELRREAEGEAQHVVARADEVDEVVRDRAAEVGHRVEQRVRDRLLERRRELLDADREDRLQQRAAVTS